METIETLKAKLELVASEESTPGDYQKDKIKIEKKNKQRYWHHIHTFSEGNSVWRNKTYYLIIENYKEAIYNGKELTQLELL